MIIYTCPKCGHDLIESTLLSDPPQTKIECPNCQWTKITGTARTVTRVMYPDKLITYSEGKAYVTNYNNTTVTLS